jgi:tetratricopeptide (TPR) repeat protein
LLLGLTLAEKADPEKLLTEGHAAFARGDYAAAADLYERAEVHSTEPARVAFYLAGAKYHLAVKTPGLSPELQEAERLYRCCLDPADPRRLRALLGLGDSLVHRSSGRDAASLRTALACFEQCLQSAGDDRELSADARYNREKVRLLLLQFQPPANGPQNENPPRDENPLPPRPDPRQPMPVPGEPGSEGDGDPRALAGSLKPDEGSAASRSNEPPPPGKGNLEPIPDEVDVPPLSARAATEHLELAARKVREEHQTYHRRSERASAAGVKDW